SFDGIGKAVLRFYEKHKINNTLDSFFSNILWLSIVSYGIIFMLHPLLHTYIENKYAISNSVILLTLILVIPCGIRQILYQILRIKNLPNIYTLSIILYQIIFIINVLYFTKIIPKADIVTGAMIISVVATDIYIIYKIKPSFKLEYKIDKKILNEILKYIIPLFFTNFGYWFILHFLKFEFQNLHQYLNTAIIGASWVIANNFIQPLVTLFIFSTFPIIIKKFEHNAPVKNYFTNICQLYMFIFIPILSTFCAYSKEIRAILLPDNYDKSALLLPIFAICIFTHEFLKLINVKYHLNNKTYIETALTMLFVALSYFGTVYMAQHESMIGAALIVLICETGLVLSNILIRFKNLNYINYTQVLKTLFFMIFISIISYVPVMIFGNNTPDKTLCIIKIIIFITINYTISVNFRKYLLK
ncbi:hypothetical protein IJ596_02805, partial [bacterium]|nr:hypothetical protein [bacterium]